MGRDAELLQSEEIQCRIRLDRRYVVARADRVEVIEQPEPFEISAYPVQGRARRDTELQPAPFGCGNRVGIPVSTNAGGAPRTGDSIHKPHAAPATAKALNLPLMQPLLWEMDNRISAGRSDTSGPTRCTSHVHDVKDTEPHAEVR